MHWLHSWISAAPRRALVIGKTVFLAGAILVVAAVFARAGMALPAYAAGLVPEGAIGFAIAALLVLVGMALIVLAEKHDPAKRGRR